MTRSQKAISNPFLTHFIPPILASGYIRDVELKRALAREKKNEVEIVPILRYPMDLEEDCPKGLRQAIDKVRARRS